MRQYGDGSDKSARMALFADFVIASFADFVVHGDDMILQRDNNHDILESIRLTCQALTVRRLAFGHSCSVSNKSV